MADGDPTVAFKSMGEDAVKKLSVKFLPALYNFNKELYAGATRAVVIDLMNSVQEYADKTKNDNLRKSIRNISHHLTGSSDIPARDVPKEANPEVKAELEKLRNERIQNFKRDERKFLIGTEAKISNRLTKIIETSLGKDENLTDFAREAITEKVLKDIKSKLKSNDALAKRMQSLHTQAAKAGFDEEFSSKIYSNLDRDWENPSNSHPYQD